MTTKQILSSCGIVLLTAVLGVFLGFVWAMIKTGPATWNSFDTTIVTILALFIWKLLEIRFPHKPKDKK